MAAEGHETRAVEALNRRGRRVLLQVELASLPLYGGRPGVMLLSHRLAPSEADGASADGAG